MLLVAAMAFGLVVAAAVLSVALDRGSTELRAGPPPSQPGGQGSIGPISISQWVDGKWQIDGPYKLRASAVVVPTVAGRRTQQFSYLDSITSNGSVADVRVLGSPLREYLYLYSPTGAVISRKQMLPPIPLSCTPNVVLTAPLMFACSYGDHRQLYVLSGGVLWHVGLPSYLQGVIHAQPQVDGIVRIIVCPVYPSGSLIHLAVVTLADRSIRSLQMHVVRVSSSGAGVEARPDGSAGWLIMTSTSTGSTNCDELASYDNQFRRRWSRSFSGACSELIPDPPVANGSQIFFGLSGPLVQHNYLIASNGRLVWSSHFTTGAQFGIAGPPVLALGSGSLCVAGFGDGSFVGESGSTSDVDYAYSARLNPLTGAVEWKARMLSQLQSSRKWSLYTPTSASCSPTAMEMLDADTNGTRSYLLPVMLLMNSDATS